MNGSCYTAGDRLIQTLLVSTMVWYDMNVYNLFCFNGWHASVEGLTLLTAFIVLRSMMGYNVHQEYFRSHLALSLTPLIHGTNVFKELINHK